MTRNICGSKLTIYLNTVKYRYFKILLKANKCTALITNTFLSSNISMTVYPLMFVIRPRIESYSIFQNHLK